MLIGDLPFKYLNAIRPLVSAPGFADQVSARSVPTLPAGAYGSVGDASWVIVEQGHNSAKCREAYGVRTC
jgi:hypothetical protein